MPIKLYNTLSRSLELFSPLKEGAVSMYHCGPTVYDTPHIGNYRTFVMNDLIRRAFEYNEYTVNQAMNITDVDDKTIRRSREEGVTLTALTRKYEDLFIEGLKSLNILVPHHLIRATDHIADMVALIEKLLEKGFAYKATDGVYMSISKVKDYGMLAHLKLDAATSDDTAHQRVANDEYDKDNPHDFALWKFTTDQDGDNSWDASFGAGRPGWHIECSAMAMKALGETIDIHTGGADLIFPHHTNEIAQSESATGKPFARYWMHGAFITMADEKMAKSKGNIAKLETLEDDMISPLAYRYWLLTAHYRSPVNFTLEAVRGAQNALIKLMTTMSNLRDGGTVSEAYKARFTAYINEDLGTAQALALVWELLKDAAVSDADKRATILDFDRVFGLKLGSLAPIEEEKIPLEIQALVDAREEARKAKEWDKADALRVEIEGRGYTISDTPTGIKVVSK
ncbi:MAG: cysteine--tRNA ligase [Candidatus Pacebacteria bacterium]|nr:cysteine--tRNA ligase [Candidatus Paceibacterota bacterium]